MPEMPTTTPATPAGAPVYETAGSDSWSSLDSLATEVSGAPTNPAGGVTAPPAPNPDPAGARGKDGKLPPKTIDPKPVEPVKPAEAKPNEVPKATLEEPKTNKELRARYESMVRKHAEIEAKLKAVPSASPELTKLQAELADREARLAEIQKRRDELEGEIKFVNYEKSSEYKTTYEKPFVDAYIQGRAKVASLKVEEDDGSFRPGTAEDFDAIMRLTDDGEAADLASKLFGPSASIALFHRERAQELNRSRAKAIEDFRTKGVEFEKRKADQTASWQKEFNEAVEKARAEANEKYPHLFQPDENDAKVAEYLARGHRLVEKVIKNGAPLDASDKPWGPAEMANAIAAVRNKAGAFDRLAYDLAKSKKTIAELEAKLKGFQASTPGAGQGARVPAAASTDAGDIGTALQEMERDYARG